MEASETGQGLLTVDEILGRAPADAKEDVVEVPEWGGSVKIRTLSAGASAQVKAAGIPFDGRGRQVGLDIARMELLQFLHGVVEPKFDEGQAAQLQRTSSTGFSRVIEAIDALSGGNEKEILREAQETFPQGDE